jgi:hypothetical protein
MLIVAVASTAPGWIMVQRTTGHCTQHTKTCTPVASLTWCCPTDPAPVDQARRPRLAPPLAHVLPTPLMDSVRSADGLAASPGAARHSPRSIDLGLLHHTFLI